ncbi:MAG: hypothetical protein KJ063_12115 [Anaerolineae bacterium]|nr:hypothetical protein [Anaerolineae bacterium]
MVKIGLVLMLVTGWLAERLRDAAAWPINLVRDLPVRLGRLLRLLVYGVTGLGRLLADLFQPKPAGWGRTWRGRVTFGLHHLGCYLFDLIGGPELVQFVMHLAIPTTPLTVTEMHAAATILGPTALRYGEIRVAEGGVLRFIFRANKGRAFALWHTVHLPEGSRSDLSLLVHEITHIYQYEQLGSIYIGEALHAQWTLGHEAYRYGGSQGLKQAQREGKPYHKYTREQQAQIAQDYYRLLNQNDQQAIAYEPYIQALRKGEF